MNGKSATSKKSGAGKPAAKRARKAPPQKTVTCMHCRYEYPADAPRCTICGYPWPWLK